MVPTFRVAEIADITAVLTLWVEAGAEPTKTDTAEDVRRLLVHDPGAMLLAEDEGSLVGSIIAGWDGWRGSVYRLVVATSHRRLGLGRRLVAEAESRLAQCGSARLQAIVVASDSRATGFWRGSDWHEQSERLRFVKTIRRSGPPSE
jgi:ribosomal protein S18 acetylase RimI-like enzyme